MLSLQDLSDHHQIRQLVVDYATAIDSREFDALDAVFMPDAYIDYRAMGGIDGVRGPLRAHAQRLAHGRTGGAAQLGPQRAGRAGQGHGLSRALGAQATTLGSSGAQKAFIDVKRQAASKVITSITRIRSRVPPGPGASISKAIAAELPCELRTGATIFIFRPSGTTLP
jgi:hypothetical protein